jgi:hypothetical protein
MPNLFVPATLTGACGTKVALASTGRGNRIAYWSSPPQRCTYSRQLFAIPPAARGHVDVHNHGMWSESENSKRPKDQCGTSAIE